MFSRKMVVTLAGLAMLGMMAAGCGGSTAPTSAPASVATTAPAAAATKPPAAPTAVAVTTPVESPKPSEEGGPGKAIGLTGDAKNGQVIFDTVKINDKSCATCHGNAGKGGVANPGANDKTVPALSPLKPGFKNADPKVYATNIDLFIEHGSTPLGQNPQLTMPAWGDGKSLTPQQIADVIAYVISLNP
jgi:mono/diheme cytochrome c family protein